jgi:hypothetical protein
MLGSGFPGGFNAALIEYHRARAIGQVGLTILEICPATWVEQAHVYSSHEIIMSAAKKISWVADDIGHYEGIAAAETLKARGAEIIYVSRHWSFAPEMAFCFRAEPTMKRLSKDGQFRMITNGFIRSIGTRDVVISADYEARTETVAADIIVSFSSNRPNNDLLEPLRTRVKNLHVVGDARSSRYLEAAIREGHAAGLSA